MRCCENTEQLAARSQEKVTAGEEKKYIGRYPCPDAVIESKANETFISLSFLTRSFLQAYLVCELNSVKNSGCL